jgi:hypothetical protein
MSIKLMDMVFEADGLTPTQKLVMLALTDYAADDGTSVYPSVETLAHKTALNKSSVRKTLKELREGLHLVIVEKKFTPRRPNVYVINRALLESMRVLPRSTQGSTTAHPGVDVVAPRDLPGSTDPSIDPSIDPSPEPSVLAAASPPTPPGPKKGKAKAPPDPLLQNPAVVTYRDKAHLTPNHVQRQEIADRVPVERVEVWGQIVYEWMAAGYKPGNVAGMLDAFSNGGLSKRNGSAPARNPMLAALDEIHAEEVRTQHGDH